MDNIEYKMAEFLVYNHITIKASSNMVAAYAKAITLDRNNARDMIIESLKYELSEYFQPLEVDEAFESDEVQIVLHKYFTKEWDYEH